eukprot:GFUD01024524.1.p1 GENE.GFUD01024524.1~~GFUD01024524.1.p1  ORF type:complete len:176 (+),score=36.89 GFUD01024524.1:123-650(+)
MVNMSRWMLMVVVVIVHIHALEGQGKQLSQLATKNKHFLEGTVFIKDENTIEIRSFSYPSTKTNPYGRLGPDAFFIAGTEGCSPDNLLKSGGNTTGIIIPLPFPQTGNNQNNQLEVSGKKWSFEDSSIPKMRAVVNEDIQLSLPPGVQMKDLKWLSLWCRRYKSNFGQVVLNNCN